MSDSSTTPADLLRQLDWMRALARELVSDPQRAEDLAQDTLIIGLERPPTGGEGLRGWIATVMRNLFRERLRSRENRLARERARARADEQEDTADLADRMQLQRQVAKLLLELDEPYRATLLMRFYGDHPPRIIAARQGIPVATVKSRLHRGLAQLRERLDRTHSDRKTWLAALAPWIRPAHPIPTALVGGILMNVKLAIVATLLIAGGAWMITRGIRAGNVTLSDSPEIANSPAEELMAVPGESPEAPKRDRIAALSATKPTPATDLWSLNIDREEGTLRGLVLDAVDGRAVCDASVRLRAFTGPTPPGLMLAEDRGETPIGTRTDKVGAFSFDGLAQGPYEIEVEDAAGRFRRDHAAVTAEGTELQVWLGRADGSREMRRLPVFVHTGQEAGVAGGRVTLLGAVRERSSSGGGLTVTTDAEGWAEFPEFARRPGVLLATGPTGRMARLEFEASYGPEKTLRGFADGRGGVRLGLEVILTEAGAIEGTIEGGEGSTVHAWGCSRYRQPLIEMCAPLEARCDDTGRFRFEALAQGYYDLTVSSDPGLRLAVYHGTPPPSGPDRDAARWTFAEDVFTELHGWHYPDYVSWRVEVEAGETTFTEAQLVPGPVLEGRVTLADGETPVAGARVTALLAVDMIGKPDRVRSRGIPRLNLRRARPFHKGNPTLSAETRTDAQGRYVFPDLIPGPFWRIEVFHPRLSYDRRLDIVLLDGETTHLEHRLEPAGGIQGVCQNETTLGLRRVGEQTFQEIVMTPRRAFALFALPGLAAGDYEIHAIAGGESLETTLLAEVEVRAGELTWVDLLEAPPHRIEGRVLYHGGPVAGAILRFDGVQVVTDDEGRFRWHHPFASGVERLELMAPSIPGSSALLVDYPELCNGTGRLPRDIHVPEGAIDLLVLDARDRPLDTMVGIYCIDRPPFSGGKLSGRLRAPSVPPDKYYKMKVLGGWSGGSSTRRRTDAQGHVRFEALPPGLYRLSVVHDRSLHVAPVILELGEDERVERVARPDPGGTLRLRVERKDGTPIVGEKVALIFAGDEYPVMRTTDTEGIIQVEQATPGVLRAFYPCHSAPPRTVVARVEIRVGEELEAVLIDRARK